MPRHDQANQRRRVKRRDRDVVGRDSSRNSSRNCNRSHGAQQRRHGALRRHSSSRHPAFLLRRARASARGQGAAYSGKNCAVARGAAGILCGLDLSRVSGAGAFSSGSGSGHGCNDSRRSAEFRPLGGAATHGRFRSEIRDGAYFHRELRSDGTHIRGARQRPNLDGDGQRRPLERRRCGDHQARGAGLISDAHAFESFLSSSPRKIITDSPSVRSTAAEPATRA